MEEDMQKYLFVFYGGMTPDKSTPAQQKKEMDAWMGWFGKMGEAVVQNGGPTMPGKIVRSSGVRAIGKDPITGYSVIQAKDLAAAVEMAKGCPSIPQGGSVAVYETMTM
jgi:hypothetical protein